MKTTLIMIILTFTLSTTAAACPSEKRGEIRKQRVAEKLNLTADQEQQFEIIMKEKHQNLKAAKQQIDEDSKAKLALILNTEQMQMLEEKKHRQHKKMRRR